MKQLFRQYEVRKFAGPKYANLCQTSLLFGSEQLIKSTTLSWQRHAIAICQVPRTYQLSCTYTSQFLSVSFAKGH